MREYCNYWDEYLDNYHSDELSEAIEACGFMPDSCCCSDCPYFELRS